MEIEQLTGARRPLGQGHQPPPRAAARQPPLPQAPAARSRCCWSSPTASRPRTSSRTARCYFSYPPHPLTIAYAVRELDNACRLGAQTTFFRLGEDPGLARFIESMAQPGRRPGRGARARRPRRRRRRVLPRRPVTGVVVPRPLRRLGRRPRVLGRLTPQRVQQRRELLDAVDQPGAGAGPRRRWRRPRGPVRRRAAGRRRPARRRAPWRRPGRSRTARPRRPPGRAASIASQVTRSDFAPAVPSSGSPPAASIISGTQ